MRYLILLSFSALLLVLMTACSEEKLEEVSAPNEGGELQEVSAPNEGGELQEDSWYSGKPSNFKVSSGSDTTSIRLDRLCWEKPDIKCNIEHVEDFSGLLLGTRTMSVAPKEELYFYSTTDSDVPDTLGGLDNIKIDLEQTFKGEKSQVEHDGESFNAPAEPGRYYYSAKITWINDIKGEASYAFAVIVK